MADHKIKPTETGHTITRDEGSEDMIKCGRRPLEERIALLEETVTYLSSTAREILAEFKKLEISDRLTGLERKLRDVVRSNDRARSLF